MRIFQAALLVVFCFTCAHARQVKITVLATTDLHGNLLPYDYFTAHEAQRGLAKIATLVGQQRKEAPDALLIDCGDTIQGSPLEGYYHQKGHASLGADPMMAAMNALRYDAMTLGNHEFNYGLEPIGSARKAAKFPWISANTKASGGARPFAPYVVKTIQGVKVAIIGITTTGIPHWEKPENYRGYQFVDGVEAAKKAVAALRANEKPDVVIVAAHSGLDRDPKTGASRQGDLPKENVAYQLATEVPGVDAVIFGHTHSEVTEMRAGDTLLMQPRNWGMSLGKLEITLESAPGGGWKVQSKTSRTIPVTALIAADPEITAIAEPYHRATEAYLNTVVAESSAAMDASRSRVEDSAIIDAIQRVQLEAAKADVSLCASFNTTAAIPKGKLTIRQIAGLYVYDNELYAVEGNGRMLREALENASRYYLTCPDAACSRGPLLNRNFLGFNYDMAQGVSYDIDLTKPEGRRIQNLKFQGKPLDDAQPLRIAINNYRAAGSGGYTMFPDAKILWRSYENIRELIIRYYAAGKPLPAAPDRNWRVVPEAAHQVLLDEVQRGNRPLIQ